MLDQVEITVAEQSLPRWDTEWRKNAKGRSTVNAVNPFVFADLGNVPTFSDTNVEIEPAAPATGGRLALLLNHSAHECRIVITAEAGASCSGCALSYENL